MLRLLWVVLPTVRSFLRCRRDLLLENLALRQQLATLTSRRRPVIRSGDRLFWVALRRLWPGWARVLVIVQPDTVVWWHRRGFRLYWAKLSRRRRQPGRPPLSLEVRDLIRKMASENSWGAPRIHGELLCLGFDVSERTVSRYLRSLRRSRRPGQSWKTFLENHRRGIAAMDFFTVPSATFRILYVLFVIRQGRRDVAWYGVTESPTAAWVAQQLREAFPFETAPKYLVFDRDRTFGSNVVSTLRSMSIEPILTGYRCPWQNGLAERFVGTVRRELLDHVIVFGGRHLHWLLSEFLEHYHLDYHLDRTHLGLGKESPLGRAVEFRPSTPSSVVGLPRVGGLHRRYAWRRAA
jgi:putative transposase